MLALSHGAAKSGCWLNTGEGGLSPYHLSRRRRHGVPDRHRQVRRARRPTATSTMHRLRAVAAHAQVKMFELKLSQGAKPGKGGILPGAKVTAEIAADSRHPASARHSISPNRHPDISSMPELLDMIERIRAVTGKPVGFKAVIGAYGWLDELFAEINTRGARVAPDFITIDSADGGTGAAPMSLMDYMGLPIKESLPLVADKLLASTGSRNGSS